MSGQIVVPSGKMLTLSFRLPGAALIPLEPRNTPTPYFFSDLQVDYSKNLILTTYVPRLQEPVDSDLLASDDVEAPYRFKVLCEPEFGELYRREQALLSRERFYHPRVSWEGFTLPAPIRQTLEDQSTDLDAP